MNKLNDQNNYMNPLRRFMVIDDDPINNMLCEYTFKKVIPEIDIRLYTNPELALEKMSEEYGKGEEDPFTILFLDINMPLLDGWEFLDAFAAMDSRIRDCFRIYMFSSSVDPRDKQKAESNPLVTGFLSKPLREEHIRMIYKRFGDTLLESRELRRCS